MVRPPRAVRRRRGAEECPCTPCWARKWWWFRAPPPGSSLLARPLRVVAPCAADPRHVAGRPGAGHGRYVPSLDCPLGTNIARAHAAGHQVVATGAAWNGVAAAPGASEYFLAATLDITERVHSGKVVLVVP